MSNYDPWTEHGVNPHDTYDVPMMDDGVSTRSGNTVQYPKQSGHRYARVWTSEKEPRQFNDDGEQITGDILQVGDLWFDKANNAIHIRVERKWVQLSP